MNTLTIKVRTPNLYKRFDRRIIVKVFPQRKTLIRRAKTSVRHRTTSIVRLRSYTAYTLTKRRKTSQMNRK